MHSLIIIQKESILLKKSKKATAHLDDATKKLLVRTKESGEPNAVILMYRIKDGDIIK